MPNRDSTSVLFVCMGNICRSPTAEGVFRHHAADDAAWRIDSAGTHAYHVGEPPDRRAVAAALARGYDLSSIRARRIHAKDFYRFDWILAMDRDNLAMLEDRRPDDATATLELLLDYASEPEFRGGNVPDPYYGGARGFEHVLDLIEGATGPLLERLSRR